MKKKIWLCLDCEGPLALNDNAAETTEELAEKCDMGREIGRAFFRQMSIIDDVWGDFHKIPKDPKYSAGHTLKVILPFFKAMGANKMWLYNFGRESLRVVPYVKEVITQLVSQYNVRIVSTSYEWFIRAFCDEVGFNPADAACTWVNWFDEIPINDREIKLLLRCMEMIAAMKTIEYDPKTGEILPEYQTAYDSITSFVWEAVYGMKVGGFLRNVHPIGQTQKRGVLEAISQQFGVPKKNMMYVGDSQTDVQAVKWLRGEGLTMMFNGKGQVCSLSDIMYIGESAEAIKEIADAFAKTGRQGVINYYKGVMKDVKGFFCLTGARDGGLFGVVRPEHPKSIEEMERISVAKRKAFRGVHIGDLT